MGLLKAFFRAVIAIFVVVAGFLAAVTLGVVAALFLLIRRRRPSVGRVSGEKDRSISKSAGDAIEVTATEVSADPEKTA
jgi:MFS superfamily sulfate permease-like transporter